MKTEPAATVHMGRNIWLTANGHKLARYPEPGAFTLAQARKYDLRHPPEPKAR